MLVLVDWGKLIEWLCGVSLRDIKVREEKLDDFHSSILPASFPSVVQSGPTANAFFLFLNFSLRDLIFLLFSVCWEMSGIG